MDTITQKVGGKWWVVPYKPKAKPLNFSGHQITQDQRDAIKAEMKKSQDYWYEPVGEGKYSLRGVLSPDEVVDNILKILK